MRKLICIITTLSVAIFILACENKNSKQETEKIDFTPSITGEEFLFLANAKTTDTILMFLNRKKYFEIDERSIVDAPFTLGRRKVKTSDSDSIYGDKIILNNRLLFKSFSTIDSVQFNLIKNKLFSLKHTSGLPVKHPNPSLIYNSTITDEDLNSYIFAVMKTDIGKIYSIGVSHGDTFSEDDFKKLSAEEYLKMVSDSIK